MARKIRDFVYGSPKFEKNLNDAISAGGDEVKIYQHNITIQATDSNNESCYVKYIIYNTNANSLFTSPTPNANDVMNVIQATCIGQTPPTYDSNKFFSMYVDIWEESLNVTITDVATGTNSGRYVRSIVSASDNVMQM